MLGVELGLEQTKFKELKEVFVNTGKIDKETIG